MKNEAKLLIEFFAFIIFVATCLGTAFFAALYIFVLFILVIGGGGSDWRVPIELRNFLVWGEVLLQLAGWAIWIALLRWSFSASKLRFERGQTGLGFLIPLPLFGIIAYQIFIIWKISGGYHVFAF